MRGFLCWLLGHDRMTTSAQQTDLPALRHARDAAVLRHHRRLGGGGQDRAPPLTAAQGQSRTTVPRGPRATVGPRSPPVTAAVDP